MRRKRKTRHALSDKPVPDPLPRGALVSEVPGHDRKVEQRVLVTVKDAICLMKILGRDPRLADVSLVDREAQARRAGRAAPDRNPNSVAAEERPV